MPSLLYSSAFKPASEAMFSPSLVSGRVHWKAAESRWAGRLHLADTHLALRLSMLLTDGR